MKKVLVYISILTIFLSLSPNNPSIRNEDRIRIHEAFQIEKKYGERVWKNYRKAPFTILLVNNDYEYLINHPNPSKDFIFLEKDTLLNVDIYYRKQQFNTSFLATFPAVNGVNCIVMGTPEKTGLNSTEWIITMLHERFHQYQYSSKNYYQDTMSLNISNGDNTGMWQLNYPFPYKNEAVNRKYNVYTKTLRKAVEKIDDANFKTFYNQFLKARKEFKSSLKVNDYKYFSFQLYQEGIARYIEYAFLELLKEYTPSKEVLKIKDFISFSDYKKSFYKKHLNNIIVMKLEQLKRNCFYDIGFAEALLINKMNPNWKDQYLLDKFDIEKIYPKN